MAHLRRLGLESSIGDLLLYCRKHEDVAKLIRREVPAAATHSEAGSQGGRGHKADSDAMSFSDRGSTYQLRRLKRDRPELAEKVVRGEMSANAAAIEAGFRKRVIYVPVRQAAHTESQIASRNSLGRITHATRWPSWTNDGTSTTRPPPSRRIAKCRVISTPAISTRTLAIASVAPRRVRSTSTT